MTYRVNRGLPELPPNVIGECLTFNYITDRTGAFVPPPRDEAHVGVEHLITRS